MIFAGYSKEDFPQLPKYGKLKLNLIGYFEIFHLARHTFATTVTLSNGVPIESVSKILGHRSLKTIQIYAKVIDQKLREDMDGS